MSHLRVDEPDLLRRMRCGDERAFNCFFDSFFSRLYRFAVPRLGGDEEAARDVVQATLIKAVRNVQGFRGEASLFTWLCKICRHLIADHRRASERYARRFVLMEDRAEWLVAVRTREAPEQYDLIENYGRAEIADLVRAALERLPKPYGEALQSQYVEYRSVAEIGQRFGIGRIAAQSLLARARVAFRAAFEQACGESAGDVVSTI